MEKEIASQSLSMTISRWQSQVWLETESLGFLEYRTRTFLSETPGPHLYKVSVEQLWIKYRDRQYSSGSMTSSVSTQGIIFVTFGLDSILGARRQRRGLRCWACTSGWLKLQLSLFLPYDLMKSPGIFLSLCFNRCNTEMCYCSDSIMKCTNIRGLLNGLCQPSFGINSLLMLSLRKVVLRWHKRGP